MGQQWDADILVTKDIVQAIITLQFPELCPVTAEVLGEGWDNAVFLINGEFVFRFPRRQIAVPLLLTENTALQKLAPLLSVPISAPTLMGKPCSAYPFPFSGYRKLVGTPPHLQDLSEEVRAESASVWADFLSGLHQVNPSDAISWGVPHGDVIGRMDVQKRHPMFLAHLERAIRMQWIQNRDVLIQVAEDASRVAASADLGRQCVVHGDLNFRNYLVNDKGILCAVLDFGDLHIGHPAVDLSVIYSFLPKEGREAFLNIYGDVPHEILQLARFRSLYTSIVILEYAYHIGDKNQFAEAKRSIDRACDDLV